MSQKRWRSGEVSNKKLYECTNCLGHHSSERRLMACPDCGGRVENLSKARAE